VRGEWADPRAGRESLRAYATRWRSIQVSSAGTGRFVDNALRLHSLPRLGDHRIGNIYEVFARVMDPRWGPGHLSESLQRDRIARMTTTTRSRSPTLEDVERVCSVLGERWQSTPVVLAGSGLRVGELLGLRLSDVDFPRRTVRGERQRLQSHQIALMKSKAQRRTVAMGTW